MIGQNNLLNQLNNLSTLPKSIILVGKRGSGKKEVVKYLANSKGLDLFLLPDNKIESIRLALDNMYESTSPTIYCIPNLDDASFRTKYTLLKSLEEPTESAFFIITCRNLDNLYEPIKSRCQIFYMDNYSPAEIEEFILANYTLSKNEISIAKTVCETPYEVNLLIDSGIEEFNNYVLKVLENIHRVELANAFKIGQKIAMKKDAEGYNLELFLRLINKNLMADPSDKNIKAVKVTCNILSELSYPSVNKNMLFDNWVLRFREVYR